MIAYLDIETGPLACEHREHTKPTDETMKYGATKDPKKREAKLAAAIEAWEVGEGCALDAVTGEVLLVGVAENDLEYRPLFGDESVVLRDTWDFLDAAEFIVGHNIVGFDIPFLIRRSWLLGVIVPTFFVKGLNKYRSELYIDTRLIWTFGDKRAGGSSLAHLCGAFGIPVKEGPVGGANFHEWWVKDRELAIAYNKDDIEATRRLHRVLMGKPMDIEEIEI